MFVLKGATIIPEPGKVIESGEIVIRDGLIESIGKSAKIPGDAFEVNLSGKTIYSGFIESYLERSDKKPRVMRRRSQVNQYEEQYEHGFNHRENFRNEFHIKSPNQEKPVSHKIFHITIFGGLALIALWIVLSEILK